MAHSQDDRSKQSKELEELRHNIVLDLAREYHRLCDAFDNSVCTGPIGKSGSRLPATTEEHYAMAQNALYVRRELRKRLPPGSSFKKFQHAVVAVAKEFNCDQ